LISITSSSDDLHDLGISHLQWKSLEAIADLLQPFKDLTMKMSKSSDNTASDIIPLFNLVIDHTDDHCSKQGNGPGGILSRIRAASKSAREKMMQYYSKTNTVTMLCTALDPRRRFNYFEKREFEPESIVKTKEL
jgi:hypothetical protein